MSMPFMCGAAPSILTVPVILPSPAALTFPPKSNAPQQTRTNAASAAADLYRFIEVSLNRNLLLDSKTAAILHHSSTCSGKGTELEDRRSVLLAGDESPLQ